MTGQAPAAPAHPIAAPLVYSWSAGKDSAFGLWTLLRDPAYEVRALLTTITETYDRDLLEAVLLDQRMGELVLRDGHDLLRGDPKKTVAAVREAAERSQIAALALIAAEDETTHAVPLARQRLEAAVAPRVHEPGVQTFGTGLSETAALTTVLAEDDRVRFARGMLDFAKRPSGERAEPI